MGMGTMDTTYRVGALWQSHRPIMRECEGWTDIGEVLPVARNVSEGQAATYSGLTPLSRLSGKGGRPSKLARGVNKHALRTNYLSAFAAVSVSAIDVNRCKSVPGTELRSCVQ